MDEETKKKTEQFIKENEITFELEHNKKVKIMQNGKEIGHVFTPGSSGSNYLNCIQLCGFTEAFDYWGCGIFKGFKDMQFLFDPKYGRMEGTHTHNMTKCCKCYMDPCQCEVKIKYENPFTVKRSQDLNQRILQNPKRDPKDGAPISFDDNTHPIETGEDI